MLARGLPVNHPTMQRMRPNPNTTAWSRGLGQLDKSGIAELTFKDRHG
jgi:hypothetical protein